MRPTHVHGQTYVNKHICTCKNDTVEVIYLSIYLVGASLLYAIFTVICQVSVCSTDLRLHADVLPVFLRRPFNDGTIVNDIDFPLDVISGAYKKPLKN